VYLIQDDLALVQTMDFFTPVVDDPYLYGAIAAANALSDVYAMGGRPLTVMNIACFAPDLAPPEVWAAVLRGAYDKTLEAGAVVVGGHSVEDREPKFGLSVTGLIDPRRVLTNDSARPGDTLWLTKPLGSGIVTTAAKNDACHPGELERACEVMAELNRAASEAALAAGARCATDVTGFGLGGHLFNVARASNVGVVIKAGALPVLPGVERMIAAGHTTRGAVRNRAYLGDALSVAGGTRGWLLDVVFDPQTSGGLAISCLAAVEGGVPIGRVVEGPPSVRVEP
jgi:selenide,water dikinase